jgi:hypothetical protein
MHALDRESIKARIKAINAIIYVGVRGWGIGIEVGEEGPGKGQGNRGRGRGGDCLRKHVKVGLVLPVPTNPNTRTLGSSRVYC